MFVELTKKTKRRSDFRIGTYGKVHRILFDLGVLLKIDVTPGDRLKLMYNNDKTILKFTKSQDDRAYKVTRILNQKIGVISTGKFLNLENGTKHYNYTIDGSDGSIVINL